MNSKLFIALFLIFGLVISWTQAGRMNLRDHDDSSDDDDQSDTSADNDDSSDDEAADLENEKRSIQNFLENDEEASQFLDQSRRLFSDQKSHMKEAKKKYEEKCERLLHPRYCPDLATWPAWNQAFASASGKKK